MVNRALYSICQKYITKIILYVNERDISIEVRATPTLGVKTQS